MSKINRKKLQQKGLVGIVIPAYNEAGVVSSVLAAAVQGLAKENVKIIVVNDGSTDSTADEVSKHKNVYLINHLINMGAGAATRTGLQYARNIGCQIAVTMDSDGQHHVSDVIKLIKEAKKVKQI